MIVSREKNRSDVRIIYTSTYIYISIQKCVFRSCACVAWINCGLADTLNLGPLCVRQIIYHQQLLSQPSLERTVDNPLYWRSLQRVKPWETIQALAVTPEGLFSEVFRWSCLLESKPTVLIGSRHILDQGACLKREWLGLHLSVLMVIILFNPSIN